ncbi:unnamed protein product, partial [marine sediment metagenome]
RILVLDAQTEYMAFDLPLHEIDSMLFVATGAEIKAHVEANFNKFTQDAANSIIVGDEPGYSETKFFAIYKQLQQPQQSKHPEW